jgi:ferric-dicitrate binding protein FerR (iron transport regulator)
MYQTITRTAAKEEETTGKKVRRINTFWWAAAATIVFASIALWLVFSHPSNSRQQQISSLHNIPAGSSKATLTLGNGSMIQLDSAAQTISDVNGVKILNFNKGQLVYDNTADISESDILYNTLTTPRGGQYQVVLPDGSKVWLNAASSIRFPSTFTGKERRITVTGEIYIEVAKNPAQPFYVTARNTELQVLGTSFNINSYEDEPNIQTTLVEGGLRVTPQSSVIDHLLSVILTPGQQAVQSNQQLAVQNANIDQVLAWKNGYFNFNDLTLQEVLRAIARWYDVEVIYDGKIAPDKFGGSIQRELSLQEILDVLKQTGVHFRIDNKKLIVMP